MPCRNEPSPSYQAVDAKRDLEAAIARAQAQNREVREHFKYTRSR